jgi:hypothetical protein
MKICANCILPETFPGISFNEEGVCNSCLKYYDREQKLAEDKKKYGDKFTELISGLKKSESSYDILMAYSGGKDSTYTMYLLRTKYNLRVLALSFDNGFISSTSLTNIREVTDRLGIDHVLFKPKWSILKEIFVYASGNELYSKKTLERASTICTSCIGLVKSICLKTAIEQNIPMIGFGWSPGQAPVQSSIMKTNPQLIRMAQDAILNPLKEVAGDDISAYFLNKGHYLMPERFPYNVHPMAWEYYNEEMILEEIKRFGWTAPADTDSNSTNCLLNAFANDVHIRKHGFHPYVWEIANMVREGIIKRDEGYQKIYGEQPEGLIDIAKRKLFFNE